MTKSKPNENRFDIREFEDSIRYIRRSSNKSTLLEGLAEEACELAEAALKLSRKLRGENPTPCEVCDLASSLVEEASDVLIYLDVLGLTLNTEITKFKINRWVNRITEHQKKGRDDK